jgi:hypothetical protein
MSFYDDASLVVIPSGYKTSKVYAEKPTDGSGDLAFTRTGDTATRVNSAGLIEKVRTNLILQSQTFDNASWGKDTTTVTANAEIAPDGTLTAETMTISTDASRVTQGPTINAGSFTASVYVKVISQTTAGDVRFLGVVDGSVVSVNFTPTNQWIRYAATFTATTQITSLQLRGATGGFVGTIAIWGFQVEASDFGATAYIPTTTAAVSVGPVANVPRLDYLGSSCPRLLLEPQRTNLALYSEQFNNAAWTGDRYTITANSVASPDGYTNADTFTATNAADSHNIGPLTLMDLGGVAGTFSVFAKYNGYNLSLSIAGTSTNWTGCVFDLQNGVAKTPQNGGAQTVCTSKIENYGNGWYRCSISYTPYAVGTFYTFIGSVSSANVTLGAYGLNGYTGNGTSGFYLYGAQVEQGAYATSYIPTLSASATRGADACSKTGISSLIGQTEGTIYAEIVRTQSTATDAFWIAINDNSANNWIFIGTEATGGRAYVRASNTVIFDQYPAISVGRHKLAIAYKSGSIAVYIDGTQLFTSSATFTIGSLTGLNLGSPSATTVSDVSTAGAVNQALLFKTRLTNAELATLTTI